MSSVRSLPTQRTRVRDHSPSRDAAVTVGYICTSPRSCLIQHSRLAHARKASLVVFIYCTWSPPQPPPCTKLSIMFQIGRALALLRSTLPTKTWQNSRFMCVVSFSSSVYAELSSWADEDDRRPFYAASARAHRYLLCTSNLRLYYLIFLASTAHFKCSPCVCDISSPLPTHIGP
jgi:hypothetical protein